MSDSKFRSFTNCKLCIGGKFVEEELHVNPETGRFIDNPNSSSSTVAIVDLQGQTIAPGYLELQTNVSHTH